MHALGQHHGVPCAGSLSIGLGPLERLCDADDVSAEGHTTATAPVTGWDDEARELVVYLKMSVVAQERTATRYIPDSTSSSSATSQQTSASIAKGSNAGAITGATVGDVVAVASIITLFLFCPRRRRTVRHRADAASKANVNSPATAQSWVGISPLSRNSTLHFALSQPSPYSPPDSHPPPSTPWYDVLPVSSQSRQVFQGVGHVCYTCGAAKCGNSSGRRVTWDLEPRKCRDTTKEGFQRRP
ncbi:uncharacterized protein CC84DRAFT_1176835 [Paraphaeosphaeria sporulosa]|uniref:Ig-like domain-containing protein n=1 Tax=Paraphaeosphaeria sporulosa TaxID=1460663 RepID=A0A177CCW6_9PLEO|nr:uncharacterized protein CC84DRAFT_1176835 [Paraphaeosphaeria sporulosa]OAG04647.1 hypothetical protein CC84DRAFT_1176835 [Paraphaeosphaeria sporulosa]